LITKITTKHSKILQQRLGGGMIIFPSDQSPFSLFLPFFIGSLLLFLALLTIGRWDGCLFVRTGMYKGGIFRFNVLFPDWYFLLFLFFLSLLSSLQHFSLQLPSGLSTPPHCHSRVPPTDRRERRVPPLRVLLEGEGIKCH